MAVRLARRSNDVFLVRRPGEAVRADASSNFVLSDGRRVHFLGRATFDRAVTAARRTTAGSTARDIRG